LNLKPGTIANLRKKKKKLLILRLSQNSPLKNSKKGDSMGYTTLRPTSITPKAHELAKKEAKRREDMGVPSSITAVISEAVVDKYGKEKR
jgi:hypothetical protein